MSTLSFNDLSGFPRPRKALKKPSPVLLFSEWRWMMEFGATIATAPALFAAKRGDGHPVLVLPGFLAGDYSTDVLRKFLSFLGYETFGWELGNNFGGVYGMRAKLRTRLAEIHAKTGRKVSIIGWSLGGVYARDLSLSMPEFVRSVITLGSPFAGDLSATNAGKLYEILSGETIEDVVPDDLVRLAGTLPMPTTSIYTKTDGIVNWKLCLNEPAPNAENVEVYASHIGLGVNAAVLWAVADRLAQKDGAFKPFDRSGPFALAYPRSSGDAAAVSARS